MAGLRQPVQEALYGAVLEQFLKGSSLSMSLVEEALADRGSEITLAQSTDSR
jgi:hypothetical protein